VTGNATLWAFEYFYYMDKANACVHCAPVKFSPITFELYDRLTDPHAFWSGSYTPEMMEVEEHKNMYELDKGR
jgi:hypothetical protein